MPQSEHSRKLRNFSKRYCCQGIDWLLRSFSGLLYQKQRFICLIRHSCFSFQNQECRCRLINIIFNYNTTNPLSFFRSRYPGDRKCIQLHFHQISTGLALGVPKGTVRKQEVAYQNNRCQQGNA